MILLKDRRLGNICITTYICSKTNKVLAVKKFSINNCQSAPINSNDNSNNSEDKFVNINVNN